MQQSPNALTPVQRWDVLGWMLEHHREVLKGVGEPLGWMRDDQDRTNLVPNAELHRFVLLSRWGDNLFRHGWLSAWPDLRTALSVAVRGTCGEVPEAPVLLLDLDRCAVVPFRLECVADYTPDPQRYLIPQTWRVEA